MSSPTTRTLKYLRKQGWTAQVVEKFLPFGHVRQDLFGIIDVLAAMPLSGGEEPGGILGVQCTSTSNVTARVKKALIEPKLAVWIAAGGRFQIHGWGLKGKQGRRKTYQLTIRRFWFDHMADKVRELV